MLSFLSNLNQRKIKTPMEKQCALFLMLTYVYLLRLQFIHLVHLQIQLKNKSYTRVRYKTFFEKLYSCIQRKDYANNFLNKC